LGIYGVFKEVLMGNLIVTLGVNCVFTMGFSCGDLYGVIITGIIVGD